MKRLRVANYQLCLAHLTLHHYIILFDFAVPFKPTLLHKIHFDWNLKFPEQSEEKDNRMSGQYCYDNKM